MAESQDVDKKVLEKVLTTAGLQNLLDKFLEEKVTVKLIPLMSDDDLSKVGVTSLGDKVILRNLCKNVQKEESVNTEVKSCFPGSFSGHLSSSDLNVEGHTSVLDKASKLLSQLRSGNNSSALPYRRKKHSKSYRKDIQKNLIVVDFGGKDPPVIQVLHDYDKVYQGILTFNTSMSEDSIRRDIATMLENKTSEVHNFSGIQPQDFIFVKCVNRRIRIPDGSGVYDGEGIKSLYKGGNVYVQLTRSFYKYRSRMFDPPSEDNTTDITAVTTTVVTNERTNFVVSTVVAHPHVASVVTTISNVSAGAHMPSTDSQTQSAAHLQGHRPSFVVQPDYPPSYELYVDLMDDCEDEAEQDVEFQQALECSIADTRSSIDCDHQQASVEDILKEARRNVRISEIPDERQKITVRRRHIWEDAKRVMKRDSFNARIGILVKFISEDAVDAGGPSREFFRLLWIAMSKDNSLFVGPDNSRGLAHNILALSNRTYFIVGRCIAMALVYGCSPPHFFSNSVARYVCGEDVDGSCTGDVTDFEVKEKIEKLQSCSSTDELRRLLDSPDFVFRFDAGVCMASSSVDISHKVAIVNALVEHHVVHTCKAELDQLKEGLADFGLLPLFKKYSSTLQPLLTYAGRPNLTSRVLHDLFVINWSAPGSNHREKEEAVILGWTEYVDGLKEGYTVKNEDEGVDSFVIDCSTILSFVTGTDMIPPGGFTSQPQINFDERDDVGRLPYASTCGPSLYLPRTLTDPDQFREKMNLAVCCAHGFGNV